MGFAPGKLFGVPNRLSAIPVNFQNLSDARVVAYPTMKAALTFGCLLLVTAAMGQYQDTARPHGSIYGVAFGKDGQPADKIGLTAVPLGVALGAILPHTTTNDRGEFRFNLPWWGKYTVYADDEDAGYSTYSTGDLAQCQPPTVEITPEHREARITVTMPPKAAFLRVELTNRTTGASIAALDITVLRDTQTPSLVFSMGGPSAQAVLLPPDRDLLIHITSDGFREWDGSVGHGKKLHPASGEHLKLNVELDPAN